MKGISFARRSFWIFAAALLVISLPAEQAKGPAYSDVQPGLGVPAAEFSRIVRDFSEPGGFFPSENLVSNETAYLYVVDLLRDMGISGGAYIGVGPEQNFTYIARIRPQIAFIVDIRRQAIIQHLMFKALFHLSRTRAEFLSLLLCKPPAERAPGPGADAGELVAYFSGIDTDKSLYAGNLALIHKTITDRFLISLDRADSAMLDRICSAFRDEGLDLRYRTAGGRGRGIGPYGYAPPGYWGYFPTFGELLLATDLHGGYGNYLTRESDYAFVRELQERNCIIPVVGDFAGSVALRRIADFLKAKHLHVSAFYTSNVEQYLFRGDGFDRFAGNVGQLPVTGRSLIIRAYANQRMRHPASIGSHRLTMLLQRITVFLDDFRAGRFTDYWTLVRTDYIAARLP